ncbi:MAG: Dihydrolipoyllysine-residue acetyltransferase component of pyruvate dehydrogenase complex, partial [Planctomycetota bacterium]
MAIEITVPRLGWSMDEGTFTQWLKQEGEWVRKGDMLFVLEGDKAAQEIESFDEGTLYCVPNGPKPGEVVQVGQLLGYLLAAGEQPPSASGPTAAGPTTAGSTAAGATAGAASSTGTSVALGASSDGAEPHGRVPAQHGSTVASGASGSPDRVVSPISSPRARRRAVELGVDWQAIQGTGRNGRVRERDVLAAASDGLGGQVRSGNAPVVAGGS